MSSYYDVPVGPIMDDPALDNYEFLHLIHEALNIPTIPVPGDETRQALEIVVRGENRLAGTPDDRFLSHETPLALQEDSADPLDSEAEFRAGFEEAQEEIGQALAGIERAERRLRLMQAGFNPGLARGPWEDARGIAEGERVFLAEYCPSEGVLNGSCLEEPEFISSGPPHECRAQTARDGFHEMPWADPEYINALAKWEEQQKERREQLECELDGLHATVKGCKAELPGLIANVVAAAEAWFAKDPKAYAEWQKHIVNAQKCSQEPTRVWQIASWYSSAGIPGPLWLAVRQLAHSYGTKNIAEFSIDEVEIDLGTEGIKEYCCIKHQLHDDVAWLPGAKTFEELGLNGRRLTIGFEYPIVDLPNGFCDYVGPKDASPTTLAQHALAHFETRKIRLAHEPKSPAHKDKRQWLDQGMARFVRKAEATLDKAKQKISSQAHVNTPQSDIDRATLSDAQMILYDYRVEVIEIRGLKTVAVPDVPDSWDDAASTADGNDQQEDEEMEDVAAEGEGNDGGNGGQDDDRRCSADAEDSDDDQEM